LTKDEWMESYFSGSMPQGREVQVADDAWQAAMEECAAQLEEQAEVDKHCQKTAMGIAKREHTLSSAGAIILAEWAKTFRADAAAIRKMAEEGGGGAE
jgi:hypothetical protein